MRKMIDLKAFHSRLEKRKIIGLISSNRIEKKIKYIFEAAARFEKREEMSRKEAIQFLRESLSVEATIMLRDAGVPSIEINKKKDPFLFEIISGGDIDFEYVFGELNGQ